MRYVYRSMHALALTAASIAIASCSMPGSDDALGRSTEITADFENIAGMYEGNEIMVGLSAALLGLTK